MEDNNNGMDELQEQREEKGQMEEELKKQSKDVAKKGAKELLKTVRRGVLLAGKAILALIGPYLGIIIGVIIAIILIIGLLVSLFGGMEEEMYVEGAAEFWFPIAKENILDQYFVDGNKESGELIPYTNSITSPTDKELTVISSPMGPRDRQSSDSFTITWDEYQTASAEFLTEHNHFCRPNSTVQADQHAGIDIGASKLVNGASTEIIASQNGEVTLATMDNGNGYGNYIEITSDSSYEQKSVTRYAHLSELKVQEGDIVKQGQVIGIIGGSGGYDVHLHFEILQEGIPIDPRTKIDFTDPWKVAKYIAGDDILIEYIKAWEGHEGLSDDGTKYKIGLVLGNRTVGYGIDLETSGYEPQFIAAGYDTSVGAYVDVEFVDNIMRDEIYTKRESVEKVVNSCNPPLTKQQIDSLTAITYQYGNIGNFTEIYKQYGNTDGLKQNLVVNGYHPFIKGPESNGRANANWTLFHEGIYLDSSGKEIIVSEGNSEITGADKSKVDKMLQEAARIANDNSYYYKWGGNGPKGYDCSGFTKYLYGEYLDIALPRTSGEQKEYMAKYEISLDDVQPGDLLWRDGHVGIYYGQGQTVEALNSKVGIVFQKYSSNNWQKAFSVANCLKDN